MSRYPVPAEEIRREMIVVNSRFIATLAPVFSVDEAREFIQRVKTEFADATHNVPVYCIGYGDSVIAHCTDAGEPSGTAGRPALAVLRGSGLGDVAVVVTRYFGGTKLGTGGLVHAYGEAVRLVVNEVRRAERVQTHTVLVEFPYTYLERVRRLAAAHRGVILDEDFTSSVMVSLRFPVENFASFQQDLSQLTNGQIQAEIMESGEVLMPLEA